MDWKTEKCENCDFCVDRRCRRLPPKELRFPMVVSIGTGARSSLACSYFNIKTPVKSDTVER